MESKRIESRLGRFSYLLKGGAKPRRSFALMMALVLVGMLSLAGVVSADSVWNGETLKTTNGISGTVTGGVDAKFANTWKTDNPINNDNTTATFSALQTERIQFARLYVVAYTANMTANWQGTETITLTRPGVGDVVLANAQPLNLDYDQTAGWTCADGLSAPFVTTGTGLCRVTSDYVSVFDVKDYMNSTSMTLYINTTNVSDRFDGRIKEAKLVYGWNSPEIKYWINEGHDPSTSADDAYVGETTFAVATTTGITNVTLYTDDIASANGIYGWNGAAGTLAPTTIGSNSYARLNQYAVGSGSVLSGTNVFRYDRDPTKSWYKLAVAILKITY